MPAKELSIAAQLSEDPSPTHTWLSAEGRTLELEAGKPLVHRLCTVCKRNFVHDVTAKSGMQPIHACWILTGSLKSLRSG
jgi:hypothetical protein